MATTFVKNGTNVLVTIGSNDPISVPGAAFISPHPSEADAILISEKFNPQNIHESLKIYVSEVSLPTATDRKDLIEQLSTDFFFKLGGSGSDGFVILPNSATGLRVRFGTRAGFVYAIDQELIANGFTGAENVGWINVGGIAQE